MNNSEEIRIEELGKEGEEKARKILKGLGYELTQPDWIGKKNGTWVAFEIKRKERYEARPGNPLEGHGLNYLQMKARIDLLEKNGLRTYFMVWELPSNYQGNISDYWFGQWLDELEGKRLDAGEGIITKNGIVIYPLKNFKILQKPI